MLSLLSLAHNTFLQPLHQCLLVLHISCASDFHISNSCLCSCFTCNFNSYTNSHLSCMFVTPSPCTFQPHVYDHFLRLYLACLSCSLQSTTTPTLTCIACLRYFLHALLNLMPTYVSYTSISLFVFQSASLSLLFEPYNKLNMSCTCFPSLSSIFEPHAASYHVLFPCSFSSMLVFDAALAPFSCTLSCTFLYSYVSCPFASCLL